ncbi:Palmitoyltransferase pfa4 [Lachnellula suecica]|uniref:Palmitoyltransferase PFA4 n=1 Tax=Lachnellula suecica TaxID=602035 RepID=A0A8T9CIF2_9HELO|nr:Palmitoyltransferase pfa4 [Lachnellula suecica]
MASFSFPFRIPPVEQLAIPAVSILIFFLAYTSQYLFYYIEPGPLKGAEFWWFNGFVLAIWWCYDRACFVDPGPKGWVERYALDVSEEDENEEDDNEDELSLAKGLRWCKKCKAVKPPRAHHCKKCGRCIPKMDHHCPWTTNCVSYTNFPHFIRFVLYAVISMAILGGHLVIRASVLWENRNLPAYLGPPVWALVHLFVLLIVNSITLFALFVLLIRAAYSLGTNTSQIESWEIERHEALIERARKTGGYVYANGGQKMRIERQEFPYDIGIWKNLCQGMGTSNVLMWLMPFGGAPNIKDAADWEVNGFEDESKTWPPPDPDKMPRSGHSLDDDAQLREFGNAEEEKAAFKKRQHDDYARRNKKSGEYEDGYNEIDYDSEYEEGMDGEEGWTNSDGDRLRDYGVDEEAEVLADDDIPLSELIRRRKIRSHD